MIVLRLFKADDPVHEIDRRVLTRGELSIGREPGVDWVIADAGMALSRKHCLLGLGPDGLYLRDDSTNGVALSSGERVAPGVPIPVAPGETLTLGGYLLRLEAAADPGPTTRVAPAEAGRLLDAFCTGAKIDPSVFAEEDPIEVLQRVGAVYRQMVLGLGELMSERSRAKAELNLERTAVQAADNNPFRWAPPQRVAIDLLKPMQDGFLASEGAVKSTFRDLMSHQSGLAAGSAAAMNALLGALSPEAIAQTPKAKSFLANRSAALWADYVEAHVEAREALAGGGGGPAADAFREGYEKASGGR